MSLFDVFSLFLSTELSSRQIYDILSPGPSGLRDYRANVQTDQGVVGEGERSREYTGSLSYLSRAPPNTSFPLAKNGRIGEIGWPVETFKIVKGIWTMPAAVL